MSDVLTPESESAQVYLNRLKELQKMDDFEVAHVKADQVLTDILIRLGYDEIVQAYRGVGKYYA